MKIIRAKSFTADRAWGALDIANMGGITTRLHWTDQPYRWHVNDGEEVFVVLDGTVDMHYREAGEQKVATLAVGDIFLPASDASTSHIRAARRGSSSWKRPAASSRRQKKARSQRASNSAISIAPEGIGNTTVTRAKQNPGKRLFC